ncbi:MAG: DNA-protecting protein DprA [Gammaproteobacteria bacterium]|nr:MAG: DNA-protecting protein DprA [Gammaproteobacteria bacterium]
MQQEKLRYRLALCHAPGVGPAVYSRLTCHYTEIRDLFDDISRGRPVPWLGQAAIDWLRSPDWKIVDKALEWGQQENHHILSIEDERYPVLLRETVNAPPFLYVHGNLQTLNEVHLAIVGSRNPTPDGRQQAYEFSRSLALQGVSIVSGLAIGIDTAAHQGALAAGRTTLAVVATGLDRVYPASNRELAYSIAASGALISEFPLGTPPRAAYFPRRNRIISGLSVGTLVVEAGMKSGSLITARQALEQGREVFALPGSIHNPMSRGCHALIRDGAKLVENVDHIFEELGPLIRTVVSASCEGNKQATDLSIEGPAADEIFSEKLNDQEKRLLSCLGYEPVTPDHLVARSGLLVEHVNAMLVSLELSGYVTSLPGGLFVKV